ncbi:COP9-signalosome 5B [Hibiscus syriacus]|uniref:COP9-signalosome 5B n=1 Tax=Hibiscus syriacus TaxID=106335 RepID=A0A6A2Z7G4_HIBSY|nr:COP9-signalosome 5B [Hibiscus syriacus]
MASISGAAQRREPRSGGKMLHPRRTMSRTTPYDRSRLLNSTQQNPNWISGHVFSPTRAIVSGATRVLSSVFGLESSSSSSSSSDRDSTSDDTGGTNYGQDVSSQGLNNIEHGEPQSFAGKIETKSLIEQLLMQESFSRQYVHLVLWQTLLDIFNWMEECDKLTNIIKSRVVESPVTRGMGLERLNETADRADVDNHDLCGTAVIEAKKWLEEKKSGSISKSELLHGTSAQKFFTSAHSIEGEAGSPVDMAKTYMRTRPPWASPAMNNIEFRSPRPFGVPLFKEETPYSIGGKYSSSSKVLLDAYSFVDRMVVKGTRCTLVVWPQAQGSKKALACIKSKICLPLLFYMANVHGGSKKDSPATGSWNIQEEIRKVRSKATEEMLRTLSSPKIDWSSFALEQKNAPDPLAAKNLGPAEENNPDSSKKSVEASEVLATRPASQIPEDALNSDALPITVTLGCEDYQGMEAVQSTERKRGETLDEGQKLQSTVDIKTASNSDVVATDVNHFKDTNGSILQFGSPMEETVQDSQIEDNRVTLKEVAKTGRADAAASTANGLPSGFSMSAVADKEQNEGPINEEENTVGSGDEKATSADVKDKTKPLSEASLEVTVVNENNVAVSNSQNSSSMLREDEGLLEQLNTPKSKRSMAGKSNTGMEKQLGKKHWPLGNLGISNNFLTVETPDPICHYDNTTQAKLQQDKPWANDHHYFKRVKISSHVLLKMLKALKLGLSHMLMPLSIQWIIPRPVSRLENDVGWYRSLILGMAVWMLASWTVPAGKVENGAFRTYPEGYKPSDDSISEYHSIPLNNMQFR